MLWSRGIVVAALTAIATLSGLTLTHAQQKETARIAFLGPLTGGNSATGLGGRNSARLAVDLRNADPDRRYDYELVPLDDECLPNVGIQAATRAATDRSVVAGVTHFCSAVAIATVDVYNRFELPVVVWGAILPAITHGNDYPEVHRVNGSMLDESKVLVEFLTGLGYKKWVVIHDTTDYGTGYLAILREKLAGSDVEILSTFGVAADQQDFSAELLRVKEIDPQIVVFAGLTPLGVRVRSQMDRLGVSAQFAGISGIMSVSYHDALGSLSEGTISVHNGAPLETLPGGQMFVDEYAKAGFAEPPEPYGPYAFVAANLIIEAIEEVGANREAVRDWLNAVESRDSIAGPITFDEHGHNSVASTKYVAQDGRWVRWEDSFYAAGERTLSGR